MLVTRKFEFDSAHTLSKDLGPKENRVHGHRYVLEVTIRGSVKSGVVMNIADIKETVKNEILSVLDHNYLNEVIENPTMENISLWIWKKLKDKLNGLYELKLFETPNNYVTYRGEENA